MSAELQEEEGFFFCLSFFFYSAIKKTNLFTLDLLRKAFCQRRPTLSVCLSSPATTRLHFKLVQVFSLQRLKFPQKLKSLLQRPRLCWHLTLWQRKKQKKKKNKKKNKKKKKHPVCTGWRCEWLCCRIVMHTPDQQVVTPESQKPASGFYFWEMLAIQKRQQTTAIKAAQKTTSSSIVLFSCLFWIHDKQRERERHWHDFPLSFLNKCHINIRQIAAVRAVILILHWNLYF